MNPQPLSLRSCVPALLLTAVLCAALGGAVLAESDSNGNRYAHANGHGNGHGVLPDERVPEVALDRSPAMRARAEQNPDEDVSDSPEPIQLGDDATDADLFRFNR